MFAKVRGLCSLQRQAPFIVVGQKNAREQWDKPINAIRNMLLATKYIINIIIKCTMKIAELARIIPILVPFGLHEDLSG